MKFLVNVRQGHSSGSAYGTRGMNTSHSEDLACSSEDNHANSTKLILITNQGRGSDIICIQAQCIPDTTTTCQEQGRVAPSGSSENDVSRESLLFCARYWNQQSPECRARSTEIWRKRLAQLWHAVWISSSICNIVTVHAMVTGGAVDGECRNVQYTACRNVQ